MNISITGGFLQAFLGQNRHLVASEDACLLKESLELVCKFTRKLMFTMTGKNHDKMRYLENLKAICAHTKRVSVFNSIVIQEKYSSRDTIPFMGYYRTVRSLETHVLSGHNRVFSASHTAPTAGGLNLKKIVQNSFVRWHEELPNCQH
jgi:hypothetical protein